MTSEEVMAELRKDYIYNLIIQGKRLDGRGFDEIRSISLETGVIKKAEGSARVVWGDTQVVVGVKIQPGEPFPDAPESGVIITNVELIPAASPLFEAGPPSEDAIELARVVDRGVRESNCIDLTKLCISSGEQVWIVFIDVHVLDDGGNIMDASGLGAIAALFNAKIPAERYDLGSDEPLPMRSVPIPVTFVEVGGRLLIDPVQEEEQVAGARITVVVDSDGCITAVQKGRVGNLTFDQIKYAIETAKKKAEEIRNMEGIRRAFLEI